MADEEISGKLGKRLVLPRLIYGWGGRKQGFTLEELLAEIRKECPTQEERSEAFSVLPWYTTIREKLDELRMFGTIRYDDITMRYHLAGPGENKYI